MLIRSEQIRFVTYEIHSKGFWIFKRFEVWRLSGGMAYAVFSGTLQQCYAVLMLMR